MNWFEFLIMGLATWRISSIIADEDGPYEMFGRLRKWAGEYEPYPTTGQREASTPWGKGIICIWCLSCYVGFLFLALYLLRSLIGFPLHLVLSFPFALSTIAILINKYTE